MIDFGGKRCAALLAELGALVWVEDGQWACADELGAQAIIDAFTIDAAIAARVADVDALTRQIFDRATAGYAPGEMAGWPILSAEAADYSLSGAVADCPSIEAEAARRGVTVPALVEKVQTNAARFSLLRSMIAGASGAHRDAIRALAAGGDIAAVEAYDITTGWPI